jgi:hypothetical protein
MPYLIKPLNTLFKKKCCQKKNNKYQLILKKNGQILGTHDSRQKALAQLRAIEINKTGRTKPELWELSKEIALKKFENKHSARMIQYAGKIYRQLGGEYTKDLKPNQKSLKEWTKEDWNRDIPEGRYLPKKIREGLNPEEYLKTSIKKIQDTKKGIQYSEQPEKVKDKIKELKDTFFKSVIKKQGGSEPSKKIGKYTYFLSEKKNKKLKVKINNNWIHFGDNRYQHFKDKTELLDPELNHSDNERRKRYLSRASKILDKEGNLTANNPESPNFHAIKILW